MTRLLSVNPSFSVLLVLFGLVGGDRAYADQMTDGRAAWAEGEYEDAMVFLLPLAQRGDRESQYLVGQMLTCGYGTPIDLVRGFSWYVAAAEQGHPDAQYAVAHEWALARMSDVPDPIPEDYGQSYFWFSLAATNYNALHKPEQYSKAIEMRDRMAHRLTPDEKVRADKAVAVWQRASN